ncbi:Glucose transport transcription regulator RGT1 [Colletotrichum gloeosporioides]|uniref:Glucose transport transcription regulator RGT1 n=1 Tax=Colletotrichum gloeosporioides TaxID=474922 RepID=A0A8H4CDD8_COLGL|nr:Glucose transport transcription regulator RGT1 [Colletotrichum gloeosporioides]KAF3801699.1 Glucose transport transcription regulator RGT1 [Colletotrichum gloeosporioides]
MSSIREGETEEERIHTQTLQDEGLATEGRIPEDHVSEERMPEDRMQDDRMPDDGMTDGRMPDERMQSYPSPTVDAQDAGPYYHSASRDDSQQEPPPPPTPQQQPPHSASVEELQLAAQLGQDLAAEPMMHVTDPSMDVEDPNLRSIMPHPEQPQHQPPPRPYVPEETLPDSLPQHVSVPVPMDHHHLSQTYALGDSTPPRKRSKVSRACDECRRKKVKCDAQSDSGENPCSNCKRSGIRCLFSRVPQKRGPSKGYIKELADRINSIEGKLEIQSPGEDVSRKRPFSSISSADLSTPAPTRQTAWGAEHRPLQPMATPSDKYQSSPFSTNGLAPQPLPIKNDMQPRPPVAPMDGPVADLPDIDQPRDVDDAVFDGYINIIHPYLPILPGSRALIQDYLAQCPGLLREAFVEALSGTMHSYPTFQSGNPGDVRLAHTLLVEWEAGDSASRSPAANIVFLQTLLLMVIEADNRQLGSIGAPKESLLGRAVAGANALKLYQSKLEPSEAEFGVDTDSQLRVRIWWSLVLLDRWHAVGTAVPCLIRDESVVVVPGLKAIVGEVPLLLIRASKFLGRASVMIANFQEPLNPSFGDRMIGSFMDAWVEDFREDLPPHIEAGTYPVVHLVYWHCRLLAYLLNPSAKSADALWPCQETISLLLGQPQLVTPLHHHFTVLAVLILVELAKGDKTKEEATRLLGDFRDSSLPTSVFDGLVRDKIADHLRPSTTASTTAASVPSAMETAASQGLQHLADLATLSSAAVERTEDPPAYRTAPNYEDMGFDPRPVLLTGYLNVARAAQQAA